MDVSVVADAQSRVVWLNVQRVLHTCPTACSHHSRMIRNLLTVLAADSLRTNEKLTHISKRTTREKLLSYLSAEAQRQGKTEFSIPFNRQQLADYLLGRAQRHVRRTLKNAERRLADGEQNYFSLR